MVGQQANFWYTYYTLDSIEGKMLKIFTHGNCDISSREPNYNQLLVFKNEEEKQCFDSFISNHFNDHTDEEVIKKYQYQIQEDNDANLGNLIYSAFQVAKIAWLYEDWLKQK